jgi:hypothetical protein
MNILKKKTQPCIRPKTSHTPAESAWHQSDFAWEFDWPSSTEPLPPLLPPALDKALALAG